MNVKFLNSCNKYFKKTLNFVIFSILVSKNFVLSPNCREKKTKFTILCPLIRANYLPTFLKVFNVTLTRIRPAKKKYPLIRGVRLLECPLIGENTVIFFARAKEVLVKSHTYTSTLYCVLFFLIKYRLIWIIWNFFLLLANTWLFK